MPDAEETQRAFNIFFKTHPRCHRTQRNVNLICGYLGQIGKPFEYSAELLDEAYRVLAPSLDLVPPPAANPPQPPKQDEIQTPAVPAEPTQTQATPGGWIEARREAERQAMQALGERSAARDVVQNAPESANPRQQVLNEAGRKNLDQISQAVRDRLKARGRG